MKPIVMTKTMHEYALGQRKARDRNKKVEGFSYGFISNISKNEATWKQATNIILTVIDDVFGLIDEHDLVIARDIPSGQYAVRFVSVKDLEEDAYAAAVKIDENGKFYAEQIPLSDDTDDTEE